MIIGWAQTGTPELIGGRIPKRIQQRAAALRAMDEFGVHSRFCRDGVHALKPRTLFSADDSDL